MRMKALSKKNLWEATPPVLKRTIGRVLGWVPPATLLGARFREMQRFVAKADRWSAEQTCEYQLTQLRRIVTLAFEKCPYYQRTFRDVGFTPDDLKSLNDLSKLPFIHKDIIREYADELATQKLGGSGMDYVSTGGSSGAPLRFYIDANRSATEFAYLSAGWERIGYKLTTPQAVFRGQEVTPDRNGLHHLYDPVLRRHYYSNFHMNDAAMGRLRRAPARPWGLLSARVSVIHRDADPLPEALSTITAQQRQGHPGRFRKRLDR
jgi:phenylacetate-CoA ligase